jgi:1,4-alpha-glucan branching enzyme
MGALVLDEGVFFRVWAPHAKAVLVSGTFNGWSRRKHELQKEPGGHWGGFVPGARVGDEYRFRIRTARGSTLWRCDPYARRVTRAGGNAVVTSRAFGWTDGGFRMPSWNELVLYELHIGTFHRRWHEPKGTFSSAIELLPHLQRLGVNAVEIMPPFEHPGTRSWGYNPVHPYAIESSYGGPEEFKFFVNEAHRHGIAVLLDVVYNHWGPMNLDLRWFDGWGYRKHGGIYFYPDRRRHTPWGDTRPDYRREEVRWYIRDNVLQWLEEFHVDGLRFDATAYIRNVHGNDHGSGDLPEGWSLLRWLNDEIRARQPWKLTIAEDLRGNPLVTRPTDAGGLGFGAQADPEFVHPVRRVLTAARDEDRHLGDLVHALLHGFDGAAFRRVIYTESHDEVANGRARVPHEIAPGRPDDWYALKRATLGAAFLLTAPGIPMLFQGQELGLDGWFSDETPVDWSGLAKRPGIVQLYRDLIALRRNRGGTSAGLSGPGTQVLHRNDAAKVLAYHRFHTGGRGDSVVVVTNWSAQYRRGYRLGLPFAGRWRVAFNSDSRGYHPHFGNGGPAEVWAESVSYDGQPAAGVLDLPSYTALVLVSG